VAKTKPMAYAIRINPYSRKNSPYSPKRGIYSRKNSPYRAFPTQIKMLN